MFKRLMAIAIVVLFLVGSSLAFDKKAGSFKEFERWTPGGDLYVNVEGNWIDITIIGHAEGLYPKVDENSRLYYRRGVGIFAQNGSGYHLGNGWIITNAHVIIPKYMEIQVSKYAYRIVPIDKIIDIDYTVGNSDDLLIGHAYGKLIWVDEEKDLALLWVDPKITPILQNSNYSTTWTFSGEGSLVQPGDVVATIVKVRDEDGSKLWYYEIRYGTIISQKAVLPKGCPPDLLPWFSLYDFTMDLVIYPGDSGSPVFAFIDGKPVIIGLVRALAQGRDKVTGKITTYSYATRIDTIHRKMLER